MVYSILPAPIYLAIIGFCREKNTFNWLNSNMHGNPNAIVWLVAMYGGTNAFQCIDVHFSLIDKMNFGHELLLSLWKRVQNGQRLW